MGGREPRSRAAEFCRSDDGCGIGRLTRGGDDGVDAIFVWYCRYYGSLSCVQAVASHRMGFQCVILHVHGTVK